MSQKLAFKIRMLREKARMSIRELARRTGVSPSHLSRIESGDNCPSEKLLQAICKETSADFDTLFVLTGHVPEDIVRYLVRNPEALERLRREMTAA